MQFLQENGEGSSRSNPHVPNQTTTRATSSTSAMPTATLPFIGGQHHHYATTTTTSSDGLMDVWASVASWFLRPECTSLLTTMAGTDPNLINTTSSSPRGGGAPATSSPCASSSLLSSTITTTTASRITSLHLREPASRERVFQAPTICTAIRCTLPGCTCECFVPGKRHLRYCETCKHGWVPHALDKLGTRHLFANSAPEPVQPNAAFDIASLVLYGCQALPIRLKILLDRLFSALQKEQVLQVLHGFGWTPEDYARGYILQESARCAPAVHTLDRWSICSPEEEPLVLQQFLRFGETRAITQQLLLAQQVLQEPTLERLEASSRRAASPSTVSAAAAVAAATAAFHALLPPPPTSVMAPLNQKQPPPPPPPTLGFHKVRPPQPPPPPTTMTNGPPPPVSPLNRLQSMQPFDFRKFGAFAHRLSGPEVLRRRENASDVPPPPPPPPPPAVMIPAPPAGMSSPTSCPPCLPLPPPPPPLSSARIPTRPGGVRKSPSLASSDEDAEMDSSSSSSALNLSRDRIAPPSGRPSGAPSAKRHWGAPSLPLNLGTQFINPATGKKRVQCNVCLKTFCDKGALKIHFSAVHLREMHKCTVDGCNMMFSSRRSRNRHSANPNPKLHSPHLRRKISPHDGRSAQAHPILIPPQAAGLLPPAFNPFPMLTPPPDLRHSAPTGSSSALALSEFAHSLDLRLAKRDVVATAIAEEADDEGEDDEDEDEEGVEANNDLLVVDQPEDCSMPAKRQKLSEIDEEVDSNGEDALSVVSSREDAAGVLLLPTNKRKRKSQNPTRCAIVQTPLDDAEDSDVDDDAEVSVFTSPKNEEGPPSPNTTTTTPPPPPPSTTPTPDDVPLDLGTRVTAQDVNANESHEIRISLAPLMKRTTTTKTPSIIVQEAADEDERAISSAESRKSNDDDADDDDDDDDTDDDDDDDDSSVDCSNALRHLENLSHGHFGGLGHLGLGGLGGGHVPAPPPLGMLLAGGDPPSPARSQTSSAGCSSELDSSDEHAQYGRFEHGQFISTLDVPIDKDNPRKCTACGKVFQNHFGVKTHYQNVHLKLMHRCHVDGCNAAFPSKRSRDRHSANLNLHRKLLSTSSSSSSDKSSAMNLLVDGGAPFNVAAAAAAAAAMHGDLLARLYADGMQLNGNVCPPPPPPPSLLPPPPPPPIFPFNTHRFPNGKHSESSPEPPLVHCVDEDMPSLDADGRLPCRLCRHTFRSAAQLKEHCEQTHLYEMHRCTVPGCSKVFVSRTRRNAHADNESLHKTMTLSPPPQPPADIFRNSLLSATVSS